MYRVLLASAKVARLVHSGDSVASYIALYVGKCGITDSAIADIFSPTTSWPNVSSLRLSSCTTELDENPITVKSLIYFMDQSSVSTQKIKYLGLSNIKLGSNGIKSLVKINLAALEVLNLSNSSHIILRLR